MLSIGRLPVTPRLPSSRRAEWADTVSFVTGRHTVETGANLLTDWITFSTAQNFAGSYRFNSLESFGRSLAGVPAPVSGERYIQAFSGEGTHGVRVHPDFVNVAAFVQDEWRARSNLTLNLGIRYDAEVFARPDVKNPSPVLAAAGIDTSVIPADWNNVAPRLGIAWMASRLRHLLWANGCRARGTAVLPERLDGADANVLGRDAGGGVDSCVSEHGLRTAGSRGRAAKLCGSCRRYGHPAALFGGLRAAPGAPGQRRH